MVSYLIKFSQEKYFIICETKMSGNYLKIDNLSLVMITLVTFMGVSVACFSYRYLYGDRAQKIFFLNLYGLIISIFIMVSADHLLLLFIAWTISNLFLSRLMLHKREWQAALNSSILATKNFIFGSTFLGLAFIILYFATLETSITAILDKNIDKTPAISSGILIIIAAMTQSGLLPFHRWLISSLNSPTPVSAIMHAGIVNGGGFLLTRFAKLFIQNGILLDIIFAIGLFSAVIGMIWKLIQNDIKRMLACSTMSQMGYMIAQCGLGLFPAAVAHLCLHGLSKAYLFLASGAAAKEKRFEVQSNPSFKELISAIFCGLIGVYTLSLGLKQSIFVNNTLLFIFFVALITCIQLALAIVKQDINGKFFIALIFTSISGWIYGKSVNLFEKTLSPLDIFFPQKVNALHLTSMILFGAIWISWIFAKKSKKFRYKESLLKVYVLMMNASQPHTKTITTYKNAYKI